MRNLVAPRAGAYGGILLLTHYQYVMISQKEMLSNPYQNCPVWRGGMAQKKGLTTEQSQTLAIPGGEEGI